MSVAAVAHYYTLPDTPYNLWVHGELADYLNLPNDGTRVEVIGGEIVVSPGPTVPHNGIVQDIADSLVRRESPIRLFRGVVFRSPISISTASGTDTSPI